MRISYAFAMVTLLLLAGCGNGKVDSKTWTPAQRASAAKGAGEAAALAYLAIDKPSKEQAAAVKVIVDKVRANLTGYREGGFKGALPGLKEATALLFPKEEDKGKKLAADKLAETLLTELDKLFDDHPDWKTLGSEAAGLVGAFLDGSSSSFDNYLK
jgi:hypothetical protein